MSTHEILTRSPHFVLEEVADGVYGAIIKDGMGAWGNAGIIDLGDSTLIFDTFSTAQAAEDLRKAALELTGNRIAYVVNSHFHSDHVFGNQVFSDAVIIATDQTREVMASDSYEDVEKEKSSIEESVRFLKRQKERYDDPRTQAEFDNEIEERVCLIEALETFRYTLPTLTFQDRLHIHGKKRSVEVLCYGGGHTVSDTFVYLPEEKVAFVGDLALVDVQPMVMHGDVIQWIAILDRMKELEIKTIVPGHGHVGTYKHIEETQDYLKLLVETAHTAIAKGETFDDVVATCGMPPSQFEDWRFAHVWTWNLNHLFAKWTAKTEEEGK